MSSLLKSKRKKSLKKTFNRGVPCQNFFKLTEIWAIFLSYDVSTEFHPAFVKLEPWWKNRHFRPILLSIYFLGNLIEEYFLKVFAFISFKIFISSFSSAVLFLCLIVVFCSFLGWIKPSLIIITFIDRLTSVRTFTPTCTTTTSGGVVCSVRNAKTLIYTRCSESLLKKILISISGFKTIFFSSEISNPQRTRTHSS